MTTDELREMIFFVMKAQKNIMDMENVSFDEVSIFDENADLKALGFDSLCYVSLIVMLEEKYMIEFSDSALALVNMNSISKIKNEVNEMLTEKEEKNGI